MFEALKTTSKDPLQNALKERNSDRFRWSYKLEETRDTFFKTSKFDLEYFGMSFTQRIFSFIVLVALGVLFFFISIYKLIFSPSNFVPSYLISNICFFFMFGFISGFRTFFTKLFKPSKRNFTIGFLTTTALTLYASFAFTSNLYVFFFGIIQMISFSMFVITFLPGGTSGISSLINMFIKG